MDAIVPTFTWNRLNQALFPQYQVIGGASSLAEVVPAGGPGVFKQRWAALLFSGAGARSDPPTGDPVCGRFTAELCTEYRNAAETGRPSKELIALLEESGPDPVLDAISAPTLIIAGEDDTLFPLDQADANLRGLPAQTPARIAWVAGGHDGELSIDAIVDDMTAWFDRYLKEDGSSPDTSFSVLVPETFLVGEGEGRDPETLTGPAYPGRGVDRTDQWLALSGDRQPVIAPPGGAPAALTNLPGTGQALAGRPASPATPSACCPDSPRCSPPNRWPSSLTLVGSARVDLEVTSTRSTATLFASLWDLGPDIERTQDGRTTTGPELGGAAPARRGPGPADRADPGRADPGHHRAARGRPPGAARPSAAGGDLQHRPGVRAARRVRGLPDRPQRRPDAGAAPGRADPAGRRPRSTYRWRW